MHHNDYIVFGGSSSTNLAHRIANFLDLKLGQADTTPHPNGESMIRIQENVRNKDVFVIQSVCRRWPQHNASTGINDNLVELLIWGNVLSLASARRITAVIPHFGYARQDRKAASRTPITAKLVCDMIECAGFDRVITMDLHADQIQGFFHSKSCVLDHLSAGPLFVKHFASLGLRNAVVLSPDLGNVKKADKYRRGLHPDIGMAVIDKRRDPISGKTTAQRITGDSVEGKDIILLDDIISTGGTMRHAIDLAQEHGAKSFYVAATHGEFIGKAVDNLSHPAIKEICVTDTMPMLPCMESLKSSGKLTILSVDELFAEALLRVHRGESVSQLLEINTDGF